MADFECSRSYFVITKTVQGPDNPCPIKVDGEEFWVDVDDPRDAPAAFEQAIVDLAETDVIMRRETREVTLVPDGEMRCEPSDEKKLELLFNSASNFAGDALVKYRGFKSSMLEKMTSSLERTASSARLLTDRKQRALKLTDVAVSYADMEDAEMVRALFDEAVSVAQSMTSYEESYDGVSALIYTAEKMQEVSYEYMALATYTKAMYYAENEAILSQVPRSKALREVGSSAASAGYYNLARDAFEKSFTKASGIMWSKARHTQFFETGVAMAKAGWRGTGLLLLERVKEWAPRDIGDVSFVPGFIENIDSTIKELGLHNPSIADNAVEVNGETVYLPNIYLNLF